MTFNEPLSKVGLSLTSKFSNAPPFISTIHNVLSEFFYSVISPDEVLDLVSKKVFQGLAVQSWEETIIRFSQCFCYLLFVILKSTQGLNIHLMISKTASRIWE